MPKIAPRDFAALLAKNKDLYLLDVRPLGRANFHLAGSEFKPNTCLVDGPYIDGTSYCPLLYLEEHCREIPKEKEIVISDWIMKQSAFAAKFLRARGYRVVGVLKGGVKRFQAEGLPVRKGHLGEQTLLCD